MELRSFFVEQHYANVQAGRVPGSHSTIRLLTIQAEWIERSLPQVTEAGGQARVALSDLLTDTLRDPLIVSSLHRPNRSGKVGSSLHSRAPIAKEGVEGSNPFFRSTLLSLRRR